MRDRMTEMDMTAAQLADKAGVDVTTVRRLLRGDVWPRKPTRAKVLSALNLPDGELARRALDLTGLAAYTTVEIVRELCGRFDPSGVHNGHSEAL